VVLYEVSYASTLGQSDTLIFPLVGGIEFTATSVDVLLENTGMLPFRESVLVETSASAAVERGAFLGGHLIG